jgi:hypothetical protein
MKTVRSVPASWLLNREIVARAFESFGLDPQNEDDHAILIFFLAEILFGEYFSKPGRGRKDEWPIERQLKLQEDARKAAAFSKPTTKTSIIARRLKDPKNSKEFQLTYSDLRQTTLEDYLRSGPGKRKKSRTN